MALPEQIRKQTEEVQDLYKQLNGGESDGAASPTESAEQTDGNVSATNDAVRSSDDEHTSGDTSSEEDQNSETYAQKWRTLQGMYNAEVPRLHAQNRDLQQRIQQMEQLLAAMSTTNQQASTSQQVTTNLVTEDDEAEYGESIDMMRKVSREELAPMAQEIAAIKHALAQFQMNVVPQVQNIAQRQATTAEQQFWADLTSSVPNWRSINDDKEFQNWLLDIDPLSGINRQTILDDAQRNLDATRVANFFRAWNELKGNANVARNTNRQATASELERQVAPGKGRNTGVPTSSNTRTYSPEDIKKFFADVRQGYYKGREAERDRIERDIFAAQRDGRIVYHA